MNCILSTRLICIQWKFTTPDHRSFAFFFQLLRLRSIGKSGFRFWNPDFGFCNRTRNPKTDFTSEKSVLRVDFNWEIQIRIHGFPFYRSIGKSEKRFAKLFSWTALFFLLIMRVRARPLFLRTVFQILLRISQTNGKNENPKTDILALKSVFGFCVRLQIRNPDLKI